MRKGHTAGVGKGGMHEQRDGGSRDTVSHSENLTSFSPQQWIPTTTKN